MDMRTNWFAGAVMATTVTLGAAGAEAAIFTDSFESDQAINWKVYPDSYGDWTSLTGAGIEIQRSGTVVQAQDGNKYVELDSSSSRGGDDHVTTNSSMTRVVDEGLSAGSYRLTFYYRPRTAKTDDNTISVWLSGASYGGLFETLLGTANETTRTLKDWKAYSFDFHVDGSDNDYAITFLAGGSANQLGGFLDNVSLAAIPLPASWLLMAGALGTIGAAGRRRRRS